MPSSKWFYLVDIVSEGGLEILLWTISGVGLRSTGTENWQEGKWEREREKEGDRIRKAQVARSAAVLHVGACPTRVFAPTGPSTFKDPHDLLYWLPLWGFSLGFYMSCIRSWDCCFIMNNSGCTLSAKWVYWMLTSRKFAYLNFLKLNIHSFCQLKNYKGITLFLDTWKYIKKNSLWYSAHTRQ